ncbi:uncharacterized protein LOC111197384 [Astyanax mexicanus]|uniref:uncharacterized protein LOC111197384 n=1 Tax=Astyanax mexicanus TaxID=7994 RepID=UPI0020CAD17C|nr:uncharacterized protein LOC111197384 [Astyanax mexicanus]
MSFRNLSDTPPLQQSGTAMSFQTGGGSNGLVFKAVSTDTPLVSGGGHVVIPTDVASVIPLQKGGSDGTVYNFVPSQTPHIRDGVMVPVDVPLSSDIISEGTAMSFQTRGGSNGLVFKAVSTDTPLVSGGGHVVIPTDVASVIPLQKGGSDGTVHNFVPSQTPHIRGGVMVPVDVPLSSDIISKDQRGGSSGNQQQRKRQRSEDRHPDPRPKKGPHSKRMFRGRSRMCTSEKFDDNVSRPITMWQIEEREEMKREARSNRQYKARRTKFGLDRNVWVNRELYPENLLLHF